MIALIHMHLISVHFWKYLNTIDNRLFPKFHCDAIDYGFWPNFTTNTIHKEIWPSFHPNTKDYGFLPTFYPNAIGVDYFLLLIVILWTMDFGSRRLFSF